jgi:hypothetical protein
MSDASTTKLIGMYVEQSTAPMFLSGFFQSPPQNFHNSEKVEQDVIRDDEDIAIPVQSLAAGGRKNEASKYTNKGYTPPIFKEEVSISAHDLLKRQPGNNPFQDPNYLAAATEVVFGASRKLEMKIRRTVELMAAQVLSTGQLALLDENSNSIYALDFVPKATHFITTGTTWPADGATGDPLGDLDGLAVVVRRDGKKKPTRLVFGSLAMQRFLANAKVRERLDNRGMQNMGQMAPAVRGEGATFMGWVWIGQYRMEMWMYDGFYRDPITNTFLPYVADQHVLMLSDGAPLDLTFGNIPHIARPDQRAMAFLPRISSSERGLDLIPNAWVTEDGMGLTVQIGSRPLTIPTALDTFGRLDVVI